jgi:hypothetical protein
MVWWRGFLALSCPYPPFSLNSEKNEMTISAEKKRRRRCVFENKNPSFN